MAPTRRRNGRLQLPSNVVYRTIHATGGPNATTEALRVSLATLARWRRAGTVRDAATVLRWAALVHAEPVRQLTLARQLAGLDGVRRGAR
jgi:hypothetical protein